MKGISMKRMVFGLSAVAILAIVAGTSRAGPLHAVSGGGGADDSLFVSDLGEGIPTVQLFDPSGNDITATNIQILESGPEFIHFVYTSTDASYVGQSSADMLEADGTLSDRILATATANGGIDFQFQSDPGITLGVVNPFPTQTETGQFQNMYGGLPDTFNFSSDVDNPIPEPASLTVLGIGAANLAGYGWRRRRQTGA
jgi:hypothetical protein